jgi:hypothetical protein
MKGWFDLSIRAWGADPGRSMVDGFAPRAQPVDLFDGHRAVEVPNAVATVAR